MDHSDAALDTLVGCLAELDALCLTEDPARLIAAAYVADYTDNPELLIDLERFLPRVIAFRSRLQEDSG
jgi:hypothetical protein